MNLNLKKGLDLRLAGAVADATPVNVAPALCAIIPDDFTGFVPKVDVKPGEKVSVGSQLMHDKRHEDLCLVSPVCGTVKAVVRGDRRKVLRVEIEPDGRADALGFDTTMPVMQLLGRSGLLALMRRRPYDVVPTPDIAPRDIFVTALDTAPLAISPIASLPADAVKYMAAAVKALATVTAGNVYICHGSDWTFGPIAGAEMVEVAGPHPAGNVGVQIANIAPINKGENVLTLDIVTLCRVGQLLATGHVDATCTVAVTGPEVTMPSVVRTAAGCDLASILRDRMADTDHHVRVISGNVLTGVAEGPDGFLRAPYRQVTVIAEGDDVAEFMGWASVSPSKISVSRSLPLAWLKKLFTPDARLNGGRRAMILSGEYDKVLPMDIMAEYLIKAINSRNIDDMEALGIYEIAPEDVALCEFVDTSKMPLQQIVRDGLDYLRKELE